jgi:hypothetical protein
MAHEVTSSCANPPALTRAGHGARCITLGATVPRSAGRSRSSRSSSVSSRSSNCTMMACLPTSGKTSSKLPVRVMMMRRWWCSRMPRGRSRLSTATPTLTLNPATTSAASSTTSCTTTPWTPCPGASSRYCVGWWQQLHPCQEQCPTTSGWRH